MFSLKHLKVFVIIILNIFVVYFFIYNILYALYRDTANYELT